MSFMIKADFFEKLNGKVKCTLCPHNCVIQKDKKGLCGARKNINSNLFSLVYGKPVSMSIEPIEKKPLFHFFPGRSILSYSTVGCNFSCKFCQNWSISQASPEDFDVEYVAPEKVVENAEKSLGIAHTYTEPTIYFEYAYDIAKLGKKAGLKNVLVTNGYINEEPLKKISRVIDAVNIDLKAFNDNFYEKICGARIEPVLKAIKNYQRKCWIEVTNMIIPGLNDNSDEIKQMCEWLYSVNPSIPLHFSRFFPHYKMKDIDSTDLKTLTKAKEIAEEAGLKYVYLGNTGKSENSFCPFCGGIVVERKDFYVINSYLTEDKKCPKCGKKLDFVF